MKVNDCYKSYYKTYQLCLSFRKNTKKQFLNHAYAFFTLSTLQHSSILCLFTINHNIVYRQYACFGNKSMITGRSHTPVLRFYQSRVKSAHIWIFISLLPICMPETIVSIMRCFITNGTFIHAFSRVLRVKFQN